VASAGNDHRLGGDEAPPAIVSIFIGEELEEILRSIEEESDYLAHERAQMRIGVHVLPKFSKDTTDRNRTSPFAFTGNKFEFRMLGSSESIADPNVVLNTIVSEALDEICDRLETAEDFEKEIYSVIGDIYKEHKRIVFNGDGYSDEWKEEAKKRGLLNLSSTVDGLPLLRSEDNIALFERHGVFNRAEINSRVDIVLENYTKIIHIEALTLLEMINREVIPAITSYSNLLCETINNKTSIRVDSSVEYELLTRLNACNKELFNLSSALKMAVASAERTTDILKKANEYHDDILKLMADIRTYADSAENVVPPSYWPYPSFGELLFKI
jgi:glutamine synthetase